MKKLTQEKIITYLILFMIITFLFPPFQSFHAAGAASNAGYSFILLPPKGEYLVPVVNTTMLLIEWIFALLLAGTAWALIKYRDK